MPDAPRPLALCAWTALTLALAACSHADPPNAVTATSVPAPAAGPSAPRAPGPPADAGDEGVPITGEHKKAIIAAMIPLFDAHYLYPDVGSRMIATLQERASRGDYAAVSGSRAFAHAVTEDLRAVSHDVHVMLHYSAGSEPGPSRAEQEAEAALAKSSGFVGIEQLPGDVALLRIDAFDQFPDAGGAVEAAYAANMAKVAGASALILDLRANYGGYPETVALCLSYFFDAAPVHLSDFWDRDDNSTSQSWTRSKVAGRRFGAKKPLFVLVSKETISGGEEAAYDLQAMKRAVVLGQATAGGANFAPRHKLDEHLTLLVPQGRAINPVTHTNWEGVGVIPDVAIDPKAAPHEAHVRAVRALIETLPEGRRRVELEKVLARLSDAPIERLTPAASPR